MVEISAEKMRKIAPLFESWEETMVWSCLQGHMGKAWADEEENPVSAQIFVGDFCFFAGKPDRELTSHIPAERIKPHLLMIPQSPEWERMIEEVYGDKCWKTPRYAIKKEPGVFDREKLAGFLKKLPPDYQIRPIEESLYGIIAAEQWPRDLCVNFEGYADFAERGIGFLAVYDGEPVAGASSYTVYDGGIEIEIDTREDHRRKGLALACASALILECLGRGLYPSWDAASRESVALAEKLGYHFDREYVTCVLEL